MTAATEVPTHAQLALMRELKRLAEALGRLTTQVTALLDQAKEAEKQADEVVEALRVLGIDLPGTEEAP